MKKLLCLMLLAIPIVGFAGNPIHRITKGKKIYLEERMIVSDSSGIYFVYDGKAYKTKALRHDKKGLFTFSKDKKFIQKWHEQKYKLTPAA